MLWPYFENLVTSLPLQKSTQKLHGLLAKIEAQKANYRVHLRNVSERIFPHDIQRLYICTFNCLTFPRPTLMCLNRATYQYKL